MNKMDSLYTFHLNAIRQVEQTFVRFLYDRVHWDQRMLALKGPRGAGKTTLMLQRLKFGLNLPVTEALYITADHYWFYTNTLYDTAETFTMNQLYNAGYDPLMPDDGDFLVKSLHIEVGGKNKSGSQVAGLQKAIVAADDIEVGYGNKVPLWMLGFLY
jgi:hypothetical protein